jgi:anti-sigma regulatory factor (Ser/Thr protein kinase)
MDAHVPGARSRSTLAWGATAPAAARREAAEFAARLGAGSAAAWRLLVVVSELVTNAVQHGDPPVTLILERRAEAILVEVEDGGAAEPELRVQPERWSGRGRGLEIVVALGRTWGWRPRPGGKIVWCEVPLSPG